MINLDDAIVINETPKVVKCNKNTYILCSFCNEGYLNIVPSKIRIYQGRKWSCNSCRKLNPYTIVMKRKNITKFIAIYRDYMKVNMDMTKLIELYPDKSVSALIHNIKSIERLVCNGVDLDEIERISIENNIEK